MAAYRGVHKEALLAGSTCDNCQVAFLRCPIAADQHVQSAAEIYIAAANAQHEARTDVAGRAIIA